MNAPRAHSSDPTQPSDPLTENESTKASADGSTDASSAPRGNDDADLAAKPEHPGGGWFRRLARIFRPYGSNGIIAVVSSLLGNALIVVTPLVVRQLIDRSIVEQIDPLNQWVMALVGLALVRGVLTYARRWYGGRFSIDVEADLRRRIHDHLQQLDVITHDRLSQGQVVSRANADVSMISQLLAFGPFVVGNAAQLLLSLVAMAVLSWKLLIIVLCITPIVIALALQFRRWVYPASYDAQQKQSELAGLADEAIVGVRVVKGFGQEEQELRRFETAARALYGSRMRNVRITARYGPALPIVPAIGVALLLGIGGRMAARGSVSLGTFLAFATYFSQLIAPIRTSALIVSLFQSARAGAERVFEILDLRTRIAEQPHAVELARRPSPIAVRDLTVGYGAEPVLRNVDLVITSGETIALVGGSGSGKTTLALALARFLDPISGSVEIANHDIRTCTVGSVRRHVGLVFDESLLFSASIHDNIAFGVDGATRADVERAAELAQATTFVGQLPNGFETIVGEQGLTLSGGQRQRIALARAFLAGPPVLILDDATSALDTRTEARVLDALRTHSERTSNGERRDDHESDREDGENPTRPTGTTRTTILIANRPSTIALADRIVVLDQGRIVDQGTDEELRARSALYRELLVDADSAEDAVAAAIALGAVTADVPSARAFVRSRTVDTSAMVAAANALSPGTGMGGPPPARGGGPPMTGGAGFPALPQTLARIALLPAITDTPQESQDTAVALALEPVSANDAKRFSVLHALRDDRRLLRGGVALVLIDAVLANVGPALIGYGIDSGVKRNAQHIITIAAIAYLLVTLLDLLVVRGSGIVVGKAGERMLYRLRLRVMGHLQRLGLDFYERELTGRLLTRVTGDVDSLANFVQQGFVALLLNVLSLVAIAGYLLTRNASLALVALAPFPILIIATWRFRISSSRAYQQVRERVATVNARFAEGFSGTRVVQTFAREQANSDTFRGIVVSHRQARLDAQRAASLYFPVAETLGVLASAAVLWRGAQLVEDGRLTSGALLAFVLYLTQLFAPIQQLTVVLDAWQQADAATANLRRLLAEQPSTPVPIAPLPTPLTWIRGDSSPNRSEGRTTTAAEVRFEGVRFRYQSATDPTDPTGKNGKTGKTGKNGKAAPEALRGVDLHLHPGETVALVGTTGAGKSTMLKLALRFYDPTEGRVLVDGLPLTDIDLRAWRRQLGLVPQEPVLFTGTVAENIAYGRPTASRDEVIRAATQVGADEVVRSLPNGYDTPITGRGRSLSAGQRQLIALARAALVEPRLLLLDEATANLDLATEARVQAAMGVLSRDRTTLLIAHRLDTARRADRIAVMEDGQIVECGSHDELLSLAGTYARLWARH